MNAYDTDQTSSIPGSKGRVPSLDRGAQFRPPAIKRKRQFDPFERLEQEMADHLREQEAVLQQLRQLYVFSDVSSVSEFLFEHRCVISPLLEAVSRLKEYFGESTIWKLNAPIDDSGMRTLYAAAQWTGDVNEVRHALGRFDDAWWIAISGGAAGHLTFTYELV